MRSFVIGIACLLASMAAFATHANKDSALMMIGTFACALMSYAYVVASFQCLKHNQPHNPMTDEQLVEVMKENDGLLNDLDDSNG